MTVVALTLIFAICLDKIVGEPRFGHPLVAFGNLANRVETRLNSRNHGNQSRLFVNARGTMAVALMILPFVALTLFVQTIPGCTFIFNVLILYLCIGARSLEEHALAVANVLKEGDVVGARNEVSKIVSRDTSELDETSIARATVESVLENGNDAIFGAIFWFILLGAPGAVLYRLSNTLDAMWGYKNDRFINFGWAAARLDDLLNFIPARLTALTYCVLGNFRQAWHCWRTQGRLWYSPNAGPVMAAGAGALCVELGGPAIYGGKLKDRPTLGAGAPPDSNDINRAVTLVQRGVFSWAILSFIWGIFYA